MGVEIRTTLRRTPTGSNVIVRNPTFDSNLQILTSSFIVQFSSTNSTIVNQLHYRQPPSPHQTIVENHFSLCSHILIMLTTPQCSYDNSSVLSRTESRLRQLLVRCGSGFLNPLCGKNTLSSTRFQSVGSPVETGGCLTSVTLNFINYRTRFSIH